jgi:hypothetical protein
MASFGLVALVLTIVGVYGVIGYGVQQRRQNSASAARLARVRAKSWV